MSGNIDYDDDDLNEGVDEEESKSAENGAESDDGDGESAGRTTDAEREEAESLSVTARQKARDSLEDEVARFLAQGGRITEVPPDESAHD